MPISYSTEKKGWFLDKATPEELEQIQEIGVAEFLARFGSMFLKRQAELFAEEEGVEDESESPTEVLLN